MSSEVKRAVWLTRISGGESLRTATIIGHTYAAPEVGKSFRMTAEPLEYGDIRLVNTSPIKAISSIFSSENAISAQVETESGSVYLITIERLSNALA